MDKMVLIKEGLPKRISAMIWIAVSGLFLWLISFGVKQEFSFKSFLIVTALAYGWSAAYHFFTNLLSAPYTIHNKNEWFKMLGIMSGMLFCFVLAGVCVAADVYVWPKNGILSVVGISVFYLLANILGSKAEKQYKKLIDETP